MSVVTLTVLPESFRVGELDLARELGCDIDGGLASAVSLENVDAGTKTPSARWKMSFWEAKRALECVCVGIAHSVQQCPG